MKYSTLVLFLFLNIFITIQSNQLLLERPSDENTDEDNDFNSTTPIGFIPRFTGKTKVVLLDISSFKKEKKEKLVSFFMFFKRLQGEKIKSKKITVRLRVDYSNRLRNLEEKVEEANCNMESIDEYEIIKYNCQSQLSTDTDKIKKISIDDEDSIKFPDDTTDKNIPPSLSEKINNIQGQEGESKYEGEDKILITCQNSKIESDSNSFNITGTLDQPDKFDFSTKDTYILVMNTDSDSTQEVPCTATQDGDSLTLTCTPKYSVDEDLNGHEIQLDDNSTLILHFDDEENSEIKLTLNNTDDTDNTDNNTDNNTDSNFGGSRGNGSSGGLSKGAIAGIVIAAVAAIAIVALIICCCRRPPKPPIQESTIEVYNNTNSSSVNQ